MLGLIQNITIPLLILMSCAICWLSLISIFLFVWWHHAFFSFCLHTVPTKRLKELGLFYSNTESKEGIPLKFANLSKVGIMVMFWTRACSLQLFWTGILGNLPAVATDLHGTSWRIPSNPHTGWLQRARASLRLVKWIEEEVISITLSWSRVELGFDSHFLPWE